MKRIKLVGLAFMGVLALGVVSVSAASAANPEALPNSSFPITFTSTSGAGVFESVSRVARLQVECSGDSLTGEFTSARLGTFDLLFLGCLAPNSLNSSELLLCTGLGDRIENSLLVLGTFHLRYILPKTSLKHVGVLFLLKEVHFECRRGSTNLLLRGRGCLIGLLTPANVLGKSAEVILRQTRGHQEYTEAFTEASEESRKEACKVELNGGLGFEEYGEEMTETLSNYLQGGRALELLVMA